MAKTFTQMKTRPNEQVKTLSLTENRDAVIDQFNGNISSENIKSVDSSDFVEPSNGTLTVGSVDKQITFYPTQTYAFTRRDYRNTGGAVTDIWSPIAALDLENSIWNKGWNRLSVFGSAFDNFPLTFDCEEGMLTGEATIDWEHGNQVYSVLIQDDPPINGARARGSDWWTEWGVFVNGILVARSGYIYPRRHTTRIPYSIPVGSQQVTIDVRCIINSWEPSGHGGGGGWSADFNLFSATVVARNMKR